MRNYIYIFALIYSINIAQPVDTLAPTVPADFAGYSYEFHYDLVWRSNSESDIAGYKLYKWNGSEFAYYTSITKDKNYSSFYIGQTGISHQYKLSTYDNSNNESALTEAVTVETKLMNDDEFLDMIQRAVFRYFWNYADPTSGLTRERYNPTSPDYTCTIGGSGFGVMAILVGIERGFISRDEGRERISKIVKFLYEKADRFHGALPHWINGTTGKVIPFGQYDDGGDLVETAFMIQGLLAARQYFDGSDSIETGIRETITNLWHEVEWDWYKRSTYSKHLYWHWSPNYNWQLNHKIEGWNEALIVYLLAVASPTHPVSASLYHEGWAGSNYTSNSEIYSYRLYVGKPYGGPLFFAHYSFLGFDPREKKDAYANYFIHNRNHTLIHREYAIANPKHFTGYNENCWGLTASYSIPSTWYTAHEPIYNDNGTIAPTAGISSIAYAPDESIQLIKYFYREYKNKLWGEYGFKDAFNLTYQSVGVSGEWFSDGYLAIDQGPIINMIENYRSGLLWNKFMSNPEIQPALDSIGFVEDSTTPVHESISPNEFIVYPNYPNPFNPLTKIKFYISETTPIKIDIFDILGEKVITLKEDTLNRGFYEVVWGGNDFQGREAASGVYIFSVKTKNYIQTRKMILIR